jgi:RNA polymerase sigma-70 factor (ECF subfamily)
MELSNDKLALQELIERYRDGDQEAFDAIYRGYYTPLYRFIFFRVRSKNEAEDLTQTLFLKLYRSLGAYSGGVPPEKYLYTAARNLVIDFFRSKPHRAIPSDDLIRELDEETPGTDNLTHERETSELVRDVLESLHGDEREIITMRFIDELTNQEIAHKTGKSEVNIRQIQSRALRKLRDRFRSNDLL